MFHLGEKVTDDVEPEEPNLPLARHTIDILCMLRTKTEGNLSPNEEQLLQSLLYDLRLRFCEAKKQKP